MSVGEKTWRDQVVHGMGGEGAQGVDLLGHAHGADLGGDGGADPA